MKSKFTDPLASLNMVHIHFEKDYAHKKWLLKQSTLRHINFPIFLPHCNSQKKPKNSDPKQECWTNETSAIEI